jgi:HPt (histidine-containing phosphotransfer) domain-containing protein
VERLRELGGDEFALQMIGIFLDFVPKKLAEAHEGERSADSLSIEKAAHAIKSSAANMGARDFQDLAIRIESLARDQKGREAASLVPEFMAEFERVKACLESIRESLESRQS